MTPRSVRLLRRQNPQSAWAWTTFKRSRSARPWHHQAQDLWVLIVTDMYSIRALSSIVDAANMQGGKSTICLRMDTAAAPVSSNAFACGAHQNSGNVLTERPTTMLSAPPGGKSTLCLGMYTATEHSEPKAKDGETETSSRPPAGKSTFLRSSSTGTETDNLSTRPVGGKDHIVLGAEILELQDSANRVTAGGNSSICFGTDTSRRLSAVADRKPRLLQLGR